MDKDKTVLLVLMVALALLVIIGASFSITKAIELSKKQSQYIPVKCTDIIRYADGAIVCEIDLHAEDDPINLYRKE